MNDVYITGIGHCLPNRPVDNDRMEAVLGQVGPRPSRTRRLILRNNGIKSRYYALDPETGEVTHTNAQLTAEAVRALGRSGFRLEAMDLLSCGTSSPDQILPNHAVMVHGELGGDPCEVAASSGICMSGVSALKYAWLSVRAGESRVAVATGSEQASTNMRARFLRQEEPHTPEAIEEQPELAFESDFLRWMLSDGAGAVALEPQPRTDGLSLRVDWIETVSYANEMEACMYAGAVKEDDGHLRGWRDFPDPQAMLDANTLAVKQDVRLLNEHIVDYAIGKGLSRVLEKRPLAADAVTWFLPHYSSAWFRDKLYAEMQAIGFELPQQRWFTNLTTRGNTGSASIYLILEELFHSGRLRPGDTLLGFVPESGRFSTAFLHLTVTAP